MFRSIDGLSTCQDCQFSKYDAVPSPSCIAGTRFTPDFGKADYLQGFKASSPLPGRVSLTPSIMHTPSDAILDIKEGSVAIESLHVEQRVLRSGGNVDLLEVDAEEELDSSFFMSLSLESSRTDDLGRPPAPNLGTLFEDSSEEASDSDSDVGMAVEGPIVTGKRKAEEPLVGFSPKRRYNSSERVSEGFRLFENSSEEASDSDSDVGMAVEDPIVTGKRKAEEPLVVFFQKRRYNSSERFS